MPQRYPGISLVTALLVAGLACRPPAPPLEGAPPVETQPRVVPVDQLYFLEMSGIPPEDTVVTFPVGQPRVIILRHGPPDNTVFVELAFPDSAFTASNPPDSVSVVVHPRPGLYAVEVTTTVELGAGATIRFKYPVHFSAPVEAVRRYGSAARYEQALAVGSLIDRKTLTLLATRRPATDNLLAALAGPGTYAVAAPK